MKDLKHIKGFNESDEIQEIDIKSFETWDELFQFQASKDGANYTMLKDWLKKFYEVPRLKGE